MKNGSHGIVIALTTNVLACWAGVSPPDRPAGRSLPLQAASPRRVWRVELGGRRLVRWQGQLEQAAGVLASVKRDGIERTGGTWSAEDEAAFKRPTLEMFTEQSHPLYASARLWDDGIIDPRKSREVLGLSLSAALCAPIEETRFGVFRM